MIPITPIVEKQCAVIVLALELSKVLSCTQLNSILDNIQFSNTLYSIARDWYNEININKKRVLLLHLTTTNSLY